MKYSEEEILQYIREDDVQFIRLAFCDVFGVQKNISIRPEELPRAFEYGIAFDASAITGFGDEVRSDLLLHPEADTLTVLPWRPEHGKVVRMFTHITKPDGSPFEYDSRYILKQAVAEAEKAGLSFSFGTEEEFYLFELDDTGRPTMIPYDTAGYMDIAPEDRGENIRREISLTLERMGIHPESSHHEQGPGQNEIDFRFSDALTAADNVLTFQMIVRTVANRNGLYADFSPKPIINQPGNGMHINISVKASDGKDRLYCMIAGILKHAAEMTAFLNPGEDSYKRLSRHKAPGYISWSHENRSQLIRVPAAAGDYRRAELRSPDPSANPYLAFALMIYAGLDGIENNLTVPEASGINFYRDSPETLSHFEKLPSDLRSASEKALGSEFIREHIPEKIIDIYCRR